MLVFFFTKKKKKQIFSILLKGFVFKDIPWVNNRVLKPDFPSLLSVFLFRRLVSFSFLKRYSWDKRLYPQARLPFLTHHVFQQMARSDRRVNSRFGEPLWHFPVHRKRMDPNTQASFPFLSRGRDHHHPPRAEFLRDLTIPRPIEERRGPYMEPMVEFPRNAKRRPVRRRRYHQFCSRNCERRTGY